MRHDHGCDIPSCLNYKHTRSNNPHCATEGCKEDKKLTARRQRRSRLHKVKAKRIEEAVVTKGRKR